jgi:redox-sensitive bicupin YhaK (pirin superfamily)
MPPRYREVKATDIPTVLLDSGSSVKVIAGKLDGVDGPVQDIVTAPEYLDVSLPAAGSFTRRYPPGHTVFAYVAEGGAYFDEQRDAFARDMTGPGWWQTDRKCICDAESLVLYEREGTQVTIAAGDGPCRFLLISGKPLNEPIAWYGPIVMNTQDELRIAFDQYRNGTFIKDR